MYCLSDQRSCLVILLPGLAMTMRRHALAVAVALGAAGIFIAAYAAPADGDTTAASGADGKALFNQQCIACHGVDGRGVDQLGVTLVDSEFIASSDVDELTAFLKLGRMPNDPASISGRAMPGFSYFADEDLHALAVHLRNIAQ